MVVLFNHAPFLLRGDSRDLRVAFTSHFGISFLTSSSFQLASRENAAFKENGRFIRLIARTINVTFFRRGSIRSIHRRIAFNTIACQAGRKRSMNRNVVSKWSSRTHRCVSDQFVRVNSRFFKAMCYASRSGLFYRVRINYLFFRIVRLQSVTCRCRFHIQVANGGLYGYVSRRVRPFPFRWSTSI